MTPLRIFKPLHVFDSVAIMYTILELRRHSFGFG